MHLLYNTGNSIQCDDPTWEGDLKKKGYMYT